MAHESYHEPFEKLQPATRDLHRALVSLQEELEAVDWYQQRADACEDAELREILLHNKREEIEHAMMVLEWLRRRDETFDANIGTYLNSKGPILEVEESASGGGSEGRAGTSEISAAGGTSSGSRVRDGSLGIGSLRVLPATKK